MARLKAIQVEREVVFGVYEFLFEGELKHKLTCTDRVIYSLLRRRHYISCQNAIERNQWVDNNGDVFLIFPRTELCEFTGLSEPTVKSCLNKLKDIGLIEEVKRGQGRPNLIYITDDYKNFGTRTKNDLVQQPKNVWPINIQDIDTEKESILSKDKIEDKPNQSSRISLESALAKQKKSKAMATAEERIEKALLDDNWSRVKHRDIAYYFRLMFEERYKTRDTTWDPTTCTTPIKNFMLAYDIPFEKIIDTLDMLMDRYDELGYANSDYPFLGVGAFRRDKLIAVLMKNISVKKLKKETSLDGMDKKKWLELQHQEHEPSGEFF